MIGPRKIDKPLVLYGYGKLGHLFKEILDELKISPIGLVDQYAFLYPNRHKCLLAVCVATEPYQPIHDSLKAAGFTDIVPVWDIIEAYPEVGIHNGWFAGETVSLEDSDGMKFVLMKLDGDISISHYRAFCGWRRFHEEWPIEIEPNESLPSTLANIRERQHRQKWMVGGFSDVIVHNEGYELQSIQDSIEVFKKDRPRFQIACYHSRDGLWKIEKFLMDNLPDYSWTFRLHAYMGQGAYIYGVPNERRTIG